MVTNAAGAYNLEIFTRLKMTTREIFPTVVPRARGQRWNIFAQEKPVSGDEFTLSIGIAPRAIVSVHVHVHIRVYARRSLARLIIVQWFVGNLVISA